MMIVTQEAKDVAVKMWESIRDDWLKDPKGMPLIMYKAKYLVTTLFKSEWSGNCLLCEYYNNTCSKCPLQNCGSKGAAYRRVATISLPMQERIDACNEIIKCLKQLPVSNVVVTHGRLWVWLHCKRRASSYEYKNSMAKLWSPYMFKMLVGKTLYVSPASSQKAASDFIGYADVGGGFWVPKWLVKEVIE